MSLVGREGRNLVPRDILNQTTLYRTDGPLGGACRADIILTSIRNFEPSDTLQTPFYNKWTKTDYPHLVKGDPIPVDKMVIWNIVDGPVSGFPHFIEGAFFRRPPDDLKYPGMRTMTIAIDYPHPLDGTESHLAYSFADKIFLKWNDERTVTFILNDRNRVTMEVYYNDIHLGGPYDVVVTFITQRK